MFKQITAFDTDILVEGSVIRYDGINYIVTNSSYDKLNLIYIKDGASSFMHLYIDYVTKDNFEFIRGA